MFSVEKKPGLNFCFKGIGETLAINFKNNRVT